MRRATSAIAGGFAGTAVLSLLLLLLEVETRSVLGIFDAIARYAGVPGHPALGFGIFVVAGTVAWPLVFLAIEQHIPRHDDHGAKGLLFGALLWVPFVVLGRGDIAGPTLVIFALFTLVAHLAYGYTLGAVHHELVTGRSRQEA